jgi:glucokinase
MVMAGDHAAEQNEQQEPAEARKHALRIFEQQAMALGRLFTIAANFIDPSTYFLGGGVVDAAPQFRDWFQAKVRDNTALREEQAPATFALVPDLDMAGARGAAIAALETLQTH